METNNHSNLKGFPKAGFFLAGFLLMAVSVSQAAIALSPSVPTFDQVNSQPVVCYHKMLDGSGLAKCGDLGCVYPGGQYCSQGGCFNKDGSSLPNFTAQVDQTCLNADGTVKKKDDTSGTGVGMCPTVYDPVCGRDDKVYGNECEAKNAGVEIKYHGLCGAEVDCKSVEDSVCGSDGKTYYNECEMRKLGLGLEVAYHGKCQQEGVGVPPPMPPVNDVDNMRNHLENSRRDYKNRSRELDQNFRQSKVDLGPIRAALTQWEAVLNKLQGYLDKADNQGYWDVQQDEEQDARFDVDDAFQTAYNENQKFEADRIVKEKRRFLKDKERNIKDRAREGLDVAPLQKKYDEIVLCIGRMEGFLTQPDYDQQDFWDINRDCDDLDRDFWDTNQIFDQARQKKDIERQVKDKQKFMKDKERAIKEAARGGNDVSKLNELLTQMQTQLQQMVAYASQPDFAPQTYWDMDRDFNDLETEFWDTHRTFFEKQDQENMMRNVKDKQRMVKDLERECSKNRCSETAKQLIPKLKDLLAQMEKAVMNTEDKQMFWDLNSDFDQFSQEAWESMREVTEKEDTGRWLKDTGREFKHLEQWIKDLQRSGEKEMAAEVMEITNRMKEHYRLAEEAYKANDFQGARKHLEEMNDVRMDLEDLRRDFEERRQYDFGFKELGFILEEIRRAEEDIREAMAVDAISPEQADLCLGYIDEGRRTIQKMQALFESGNPEEAEELGFTMEELGMKAEKDCGQFFEEGPGADYEAFNEVYVHEDFRDVSQAIFEKIKGDVANKVLEHIKNNSDIFNSILENVGAQFADQVARTLEAATFVPEEVQEELLSRKAALLEQVQEMEELTQRLQELKKLAAAELQELQAVRNEIANYNFIGDAGDEMEEALNDFETEVESSPKAEIARKIAELKKQAAEKIQEAKEDKFERGIIAFLDADDNEWWARFAVVAKERGFVKGTGVSGFTEMDPGANTNVAEACTMFGRLVGVDPNAKPSSNVGQRMPDWARPGCAALERRGIDLDALFGRQQPGDTVRRAQVARLLHEVFNLPVPSSSPAFKDLGEATNEEVLSIRAVSDAGIMTGYEDGSGEFGVDDPLNRAALVKVITGAVEMQEGESGVPPPAELEE